MGETILGHRPWKFSPEKYQYKNIILMNLSGKKIDLLICGFSLYLATENALHESPGL